MTDLWELENEIAAEGYETLCGVDEAGRGPLAGPVYAAAVILPRGLVIPGLNDSKKLTEKKREELFDVICEQALDVQHRLCHGGGDRGAEHPRRHHAGHEPGHRGPAAAAGAGADRRQPERGDRVPSRCVVKGDATCADIAAASILAKVSRDRYMLELAKQYPEYHFEQHKGYGTALHYEALRQYGPSPVHRPSFLRKMH